MLTEVALEVQGPDKESTMNLTYEDKIYIYKLMMKGKYEQVKNEYPFLEKYLIDDMHIVLLRNALKVSINNFYIPMW